MSTEIKEIPPVSGKNNRKRKPSIPTELSIFIDDINYVVKTDEDMTVNQLYAILSLGLWFIGTNGGSSAFDSDSIWQFIEDHDLAKYIVPKEKEEA